MQLIFAMLICGSLEIEAAKAKVAICEAKAESARVDLEIAAELTSQRRKKLKRAQNAVIAYSPEHLEELEHLVRLAELQEKKAAAEIKRCEADVAAAQIEVRILESKRNDSD